MTNSHPTIRDVARLASVSHQTVSRVINGRQEVTAQTRQRVEAAIAELGYLPNAIARSMAMGTTRTIACISPNLTDYTFASIIEGAENEARKAGYFLLSSSANSSESFSALVEELVGHRRVDGLIVMNPYSDTRYEHIPRNFPLVFVGARAREADICSVSLDDRKAAYEATQHLISLGHSCIGMITGPMIEDCCLDRSSGYLQALKDAHLPIDRSIIYEGDWSASSGQDALLFFKKESRIPSAIFAQNDRIALGVLHAARDMGLQIPEQLAVIGVDDMPLASYFDPPLTTMHQDLPKIGQEAVHMLIKTIDKSIDKCTQKKISAQLIIRLST